MGAKISKPDGDDIDALLVYAIYKRDVEDVYRLLDQGADVNNRKNKEGYTPLTAGCGTGVVELVQLLLERGADVNMRDGIYKEDTFETWRTTPLYAALKHRHEEVVALLLEHGANVRILASEMVFEEETVFMTHLMLAADGGLQHSTKLLLEHGANVDKLVCCEGVLITALFVADSVEVAKLLLEYGAQVNYQPMRGGRTALMKASEDGRCEVAEFFLENGAEIDLQDSEGTSALMFAVAGSQSKKIASTVEMLLRHGAQVSLQNSQGQTALDLAREKGLGVVELLLSNSMPSMEDTSSGEMGDPTTESLDRAEKHYFLQAVLEMLSSLGAQVRHALEYMRNGFAEHDERITQQEERIKEQDETLSNLKTRLDDLDAKMDTMTVQNNPQPSERPELAEAQRLLHQLASEWQNIGVYLKIPAGVLKNIDKSYRGHVVDCLREMLTEWLSGVDPPPTWQALADAVRQFDPRRAQQIENIYKRT